MKIVIPDDYQDAVRHLDAFDRLASPSSISPRPADPTPLSGRGVSDCLPPGS